MSDSRSKAENLKLGSAIWGAGMLGVVALILLHGRQLLEGQDLPVPLSVALLISLVQSAVFLGLAVWAGTALAPRVGLGAPTFAAIVAAGDPIAALRQQVVPGLVGGLLGAGILLGAQVFVPGPLAAVPESASPPLIARLLYGGVTEEVLIRWGLMTVFLWLGWRFVQRDEAAPRQVFVWVAIVLSAVLFGAGHLPAASALVGTLTLSVVTYILLVNAAFGVVAGYLFFRYGLEAAIIAHALAHLFAYLAL